MRAVRRRRHQGIWRICRACFWYVRVFWCIEQIDAFAVSFDIGADGDGDGERRGQVAWLVEHEALDGAYESLARWTIWYRWTWTWTWRMRRLNLALTTC